MESLSWWDVRSAAPLAVFESGRTWWTWDASCAASAVPSKSAQVTPVYGAGHRTAANKALIVHFFNQLFNHGHLAAIDSFVRPDYIQHNPALADGAQALRDWVSGLKAAYPESHVTIKKAIVQGDLVILHSNFVPKPGTKGTAAFDIFRLEQGKIAEH